MAAILPASVTAGLVHIGLYALGLGIGLFAIAVLGHTLIAKLGWLRNPYGWFAKTVGVLFIAVGLAIIFGLDKDAQSFILDQAWFQRFLEYEFALQP